ncbi:MAG: ATP-binding protein [Chloroflexi bacterium]|nr:ATP-binding protein [Chloroflexota bacterium]
MSDGRGSGDGHASDGRGRGDGAVSASVRPGADGPGADGPGTNGLGANGLGADEDRLGLIVEGSLTDGLTARLDAATSVEDIRVGRFVRIDGLKHDFFCLVTDVRLHATSQDVLADPPVPADAFTRAVLAGTTAYGALAIQPMLMLARDGQPDADSGEAGPRPVRTIPPHFAPVYSAAAEDFDKVFGEPADFRFEIGQPLDMDIPVRLDLKRFVERSNGVFGKSGTGKSFLTRLLHCGIVQSGVAVNLIFDMHSEYGWTSQSESGAQVRGLRSLFNSTKVAVYTLDPESQTKNDGVIRVGLNEIEIEDIALLADDLQLNPTAVESAGLCEDKYGTRWIETLIDDDADLEAIASATKANSASLGALRRKLASITRLKFVHRRVTEKDSGLDRLIGALDLGQHVVLEFGQHRTLLAYMLAANVITRRIHRTWTEKVEAYKQAGSKGQAPRQLMITIEEAHKFLNPRAAAQTIFGTIARELRKYNVTLLVVDQRPSGIDDEVLSQIGTRIVCQLNDDKDIDAVLAGVSGAGHLRAVLATLDSRQQAMILGHAVPMPLALRTRAYDGAFYRSLGPWGGDPVAASVVLSRKYEDLFPDD